MDRLEVALLHATPCEHECSMGDLHIRYSGISHIGSTSQKENQDSFCMSSLDPDTVLLGVFDGHGPEIGQIAAQAARSYFVSSLQNHSLLEKLLEHPEKELRRLFQGCHRHLFQRFKSFYEAHGVVVREERGGYLVKRLNRSQPFTCVYGGTTATLAIIHKRRLIVANTGDSLALLSGNGMSDRPLHRHVSCSTAPTYSSQHSSGCSNQEDDDSRHNWTVLSGNHTPDSSTEYETIMRKDCTLQFVYDTADQRTEGRTPIFQSHLKQDDGNYVKNVRNEWATLVATPQDATYPDSLAFTRSLGDFHMHFLGLTCEPDIVETEIQPGSMLVLATDGVWDLWHFDELVAHLKNHANQPESSVRIQEFMHVNYSKGKELFGSCADNMTAVVCMFESEAANDKEQ